MRHARIVFGVTIGVALSAACGSSNSTTGSNDAGEAGIGDDGSTTISCGTGSGPLCASGSVCCMPMFNIGSLAGLLMGGGGGGGGLFPTPSCVPTGSCSGTTMGCNDATNCSSGQVCCSGTPTPEGGSEAGAGGAGGGLAGGFGGIASMGMTACQATCMPGQQQRCTSGMECKGGQTCQAPNFGGAGGGFGGEGGLGGLLGGGGGLPGFTIPMSCAAPPAEGGIDSGMSGETGTPTDAQPEAQPDAPPESGSTPDAGTDGSSAVDGGSQGDAADQ